MASLAAHEEVAEATLSATVTPLVTSPVLPAWAASPGLRGAARQRQFGIFRERVPGWQTAHRYQIGRAHV